MPTFRPEFFLLDSRALQASLGLQTRVESRGSQPRITRRERMPSVNGFWAVYDESVSITRLFYMRSSFTGCSMLMSSTSIVPDRIKGSRNRFQTA